jgi:hypothetical protein
MRFAAAGVFCLLASAAMAQSVALPKGIYSFGPDQTIADIGKVEWAPLKLDGFAPGIEIASLRGDLAKGVQRFYCERRPITWCPVTAIRATRCTSG